MEKRVQTHGGKGGYLEALLNGSPHAIIAINSEGIITFANQQACELTEREMKELVGQSITIVYASVEAARETNRKLYLSGGIIHDHESMVKTKKGRLVPIRICASHLRDTAGNYTGAVGYFQKYQPLTEDGKKAQARIDELEAQLEEWKDIGTPIYEHLPGLSYVRVVGRLDDDRLRQVTSNLLTHIRTYKTIVVRIDLSAALIDDPAGVATELLKMIRSVRLLGAESILTGMETRLVLAMEPLVTDVSLIKSFGSMDAALEAALNIIGYEIRKKQQA